MYALTKEHNKAFPFFTFQNDPHFTFILIILTIFPKLEEVRVILSTTKYQRLKEK